MIYKVTIFVVSVIFTTNTVYFNTLDHFLIREHVPSASFRSQFIIIPIYNNMFWPRCVNVGIFLCNSVDKICVVILIEIHILVIWFLLWKWIVCGGLGWWLMILVRLLLFLSNFFFNIGIDIFIIIIQTHLWSKKLLQIVQKLVDNILLRLERELIHLIYLLKATNPFSIPII